MRLWSLHPKYLDSKGLVALWREALLAQKVLQGLTKGYRHHPQLERFRACKNPVSAIATYLDHVYAEALRRGYQFDRKKIAKGRVRSLLPVTSGQLKYEQQHLVKKLNQRDPDMHKRIKNVKTIRPHPLFKKTRGGIEEWERS